MERRAELEPLSKEFTKLDKEYKEIAKSEPKENIIIGDFIISKKAYTINRKPSPGGTYKGVKVSIKKLEG